MWVSICLLYLNKHDRPKTQGCQHRGNQGFTNEILKVVENSVMENDLGNLDDRFDEILDGLAVRRRYYPPHKADSKYLHNDGHNFEKISKVIHEIEHFLQGFEYHVYDCTDEPDNVIYCEFHGSRSPEYVIDGFNG